MAPRRASGRTAAALAALLGIIGLGCGDGSSRAGGGTQARFETTRLCPLVPARDAAAAAFPPTPPARVFGTDLGFTYERDGVITILFGDSWQRIDICPIQVNDDSLATLAKPADDWIGFTASASIPDEQCPELSFANDAAGTSFAPIELRRPDGTLVPLGPLNTPVAAFYDGVREWAVFIVGGGQACSAEAATGGAPCPTDLSPQAADLRCGFAGPSPLCLDPTSTKQGAGSQAFYLHFGERVGPASYVSRAAFLTNKYLNLTARAVRAFDPDDVRRSDYRPGTGALLLWGRPGFDDQGHDGEAPPYFMVHPLPLELDGDHLDFRPRYLTGLDGGEPAFGSSQRDAIPLYTGELEPVNQAAVSYVEPLSRWLMIYGGGVVDFADPDGTSGASQPVRGALYARLAADAWGPWTDPAPILTEEQVAEDFVCGKHAPAGCLATPDPAIRPACIEFVDRSGGGALYGANVIDSLTRSASGSTGRGRAADVFWDVSTWHPYSVVLVKSRVEID